MGTMVSVFLINPMDLISVSLCVCRYICITLQLTIAKKRFDYYLVIEHIALGDAAQLGLCINKVYQVRYNPLSSYKCSLFVDRVSFVKLLLFK